MKITNKLGNYLALTLGAGAAVTSAEGATTVTVYGSGITPPAGINPSPSVTAIFAGWSILDDGGYNNNSMFKVGTFYGQLFTSGTDLGYYTATSVGFFLVSDAGFGATSGDANYANISLNGNDGVYESVGQFHIGSGELWLIALAKNDDNSALSISAGKTAIDGASGSGATSAVPEVSSHLALLALGSAGVLTRRRLKRAA